MTTPGRFTSIASTPTGTPLGVSAREGWLSLGWACFQLVVVAVLFQAANVADWGGALTFGLLAGFLLGQAAWSMLVARARRVHPRGFNAMARAAGVWAVFVVLAGGWFWIAQGPHPTPAWVTTLTAVIALAPSVAAGFRLLTASRTQVSR